MIKKIIKKDTQIFIIVWVVILISIVIMFLFMQNSSKNSNFVNNNNNNNLKTTAFNSIITGNTNKGNVEIELTPHKPQNGKIVVDFLLTTHSVETKGFDLKQITKLEINGKFFSPISVPTLNGHHNSGEIIFEIGNINSQKFKITIKKIPSLNLREFNWS